MKPAARRNDVKPFFVIDDFSGYYAPPNESICGGGDNNSDFVIALSAKLGVK